MGELDRLVSTDCLECSDDFGPPPDDILQIPPPPLPYFLRPETNNETAQCSHQCAWAPHHPGVEYVEFSHHGTTSDDTWFIIILALCVGALLLGAILTLLLFKFRSKIVHKSSIQVASTIVKSKNCESVLYPYPPAPTPDSRILWATLTPRGTTHHYTTPGSQPQEKPPYTSPTKPSLPPPDPPISFDNTGFDSDSQTPLMESYQLNELVESDGTSDSSTLRKAQRPRVSTPTRIEHPNLPPLNLHPHRSIRRAALHRRESDVPSSSSPI